MTLNTNPFRTLSDAMNDRHNNDTTSTLNYGHDRKPATAITTTVRDDLVDESTLVLTVCDLRRSKRSSSQLFDISTLREQVLLAGESWPPRRLWFDGFRAALTK